jgi:hypothetical protein
MLGQAGNGRFLGDPTVEEKTPLFNTRYADGRSAAPLADAVVIPRRLALKPS